MLRGTLGTSDVHDWTLLRRCRRARSPRRRVSHRARPRCELVRLFRQLAVMVALGAHLCAPLLKRERAVAPLGCVHVRWIVRRVVLVGEGGG